MQQLFIMVEFLAPDESDAAELASAVESGLGLIDDERLNGVTEYGAFVPDASDEDTKIELLTKLKILQMQEAEDACYFDFGDNLKTRLEDELSPEMVQLAELEAERILREDCEE